MHINAPAIEAHCTEKYGGEIGVDGAKKKKQFVSMIKSTSARVQGLLGIGGHAVKPHNASSGDDSHSVDEDYRVFVLGAFLTTDLSVSPYRDVLPADKHDHVVQLDVPTREKLFDVFVRETKRLGPTDALKRDFLQCIREDIL